MNRKCKIPIAIPVALSDTVSLRRIRDDDLSAITSRSQADSTPILGRSYTITVDDFDVQMTDSQVYSMMVAASFCLNVFSESGPISLGKMFVTKTVRTTTLQSSKKIAGSSPYQKSDFSIPKGTPFAEIKALFEATVCALKNKDSLIITIARFNSAVSRDLTDEKLIDLCIALESIFDSNTEISFQFALFNTILSEKEPDERMETFNMLKKFYSQRSTVVHGSGKPDEAWITQKWDQMVSIAKAAIIRKIWFFEGDAAGDWNQYLKKLALGAIP